MTFYIYIMSIILGAAGAWLVSRYGRSLALIDYPNERSSHQTATPKGGGVGIITAFLLASFIIGMPLLFLLPVGFISLFGFYNDRNELSPAFRLLIQFAVSIVLITGMQHIQGNPVYSILLISLWAVYIVGTTNFYNFMDGINGIAAVTGIVAYGLLAVYLYLQGNNIYIAPLIASVSFACLGFLPFNMPRAKVFMGDAGSIMLGFVFAALVFLLSEGLLDFICYASLLFPFYIDELNTMVIRLKNGDKLFKAHRKHLYQLFANEKGVNHWKISLSYGLLQLVVGSSTLLLKPYGTLPVFLFLFVCSLGFIWIDFSVRSKLENKIR